MQNKKNQRISFYLAAAVAVLLYYGGAASFRIQGTNYFNLAPWPDGVEYFASSVSLLKGRGFSLRIGNGFYPPRYPPGYPILIAAWNFFQAPDRYIFGPFRVNQIVGALVLVGVFLFYSRSKRYAAGAVALLLISTMPAFIVFSRSSMSELLGAAMIICVYALVHRGNQTGKRSCIYLACFILGLSSLVRLQLVFFAPVLLALLPRCLAANTATQLRLGGGIALALAVGFLPLMVFNWLTFGSSTQTGYAYWVPQFASFHQAFGFGYLSDQFSMLGALLTGRYGIFCTTNCFGSRYSFTAAFLWLAFIAYIAEIFRSYRLGSFRNAHFLMLLSGIPFLWMILFYFYADPRFYLPLCMLSVFVTARAFENSWIRGGPKFLVMFLLLALTISGLVYSPWEERGKWRSATLDTLDPVLAAGPARNYEISEKFLGLIPAGKKVTVFSPLNPAFLNALFPEQVSAFPSNEMHDYRLSKKFSFKTSDIRHVFEEAQASKSAVYYLDPNASTLQELVEKNPSLNGKGWEKVDPTGVFEFAISR